MTDDSEKKAGLDDLDIEFLDLDKAPAPQQEKPAAAPDAWVPGKPMVGKPVVAKDAIVDPNADVSAFAGAPDRQAFLRRDPNQAAPTGLKRETDDEDMPLIVPDLETDEEKAAKANAPLSLDDYKVTKSDTPFIPEAAAPAEAGSGSLLGFLLGSVAVFALLIWAVTKLM